MFADLNGGFLSEAAGNSVEALQVGDRLFDLAFHTLI